MAPADPYRQRVSRGQRLGIRLQRAQRWEFWPGWLFYIPIVIWILLCGLRHRQPTAFSATNPGMDNGSVVGERKSRMLLPLQEALPDVVPPTRLLDASFTTACAEVLALADDCGWPLVLKPDIGQRGRGVAIIHSPAQARAYLKIATAPGLGFRVLAQAFAGGDEYGVFVRREPGHEEFHISSVTHKALPTLVGDGQHSLAQRILDDDRARLIAPLLFTRHADQLDDILPAGEERQLVELGAHCRGAEFRNAMALTGPALSATMTRIAQALPGFDFGRIDLRARSPEDLRQGRHIQVLEINGVTSEPAHVYHPGTSLWQGLRVFCEHWSHAFELGRERVRHDGIRPLSPLQLLALFREDLRRFAPCEAASHAAMTAGGRKLAAPTALGEPDGLAGADPKAQAQ